MAARDSSDIAQVSVGRSHRTERRAADRLKDEPGSFAVAGLQCIIELLREFVAALLALVSAVVRAAVCVRRIDLDGIAQHGQVDLAAQQIGTHRHGAHGRAVIALAPADDAMTLGLTDLDLILPRQLERGLYRFRSAAGEKDGAAAEILSGELQ